jgi:hypothetical protein
MPNFASRHRQLRPGRAAGSIDNFMTKSLPQRTTWIRKFILFDRFQFGLPPGWNAIILAAEVGIDPVGVRP